MTFRYVNHFEFLFAFKEKFVPLFTLTSARLHAVSIRHKHLAESRDMISSSTERKKNKSLFVAVSHGYHGTVGDHATWKWRSARDALVLSLPTAIDTTSRRGAFILSSHNILLATGVGRMLPAPPPTHSGCWHQRTGPIRFLAGCRKGD